MLDHRRIVLIVGLLFSSLLVNAWGFWAHQRINHYACFTLPPAMFAFYKVNIDYITSHAVDPDQRRYSDPDEAPRHFIDIDHYGSVEAIPFRFDDAVCMYSADTVQAHGIVPWAIQDFYFRLVKAFSSKDVGHILYYSACLGHYIGDAHVPLHCTHNYNGQFTGQNGIHGFWESRLPELFGSEYDYLSDRATYIDHPLKRAWITIRHSSEAVDSVLSFEKNLNDQVADDLKYTFELRGQFLVRTYSTNYSKAYDTMLDGQVERRMRCAVQCVGDYWYSAWVDAGMPDLSLLCIDEKMKIDSGDYQFNGSAVLKGDREE